MALQRLFPPWEQIIKFRNPLTEGESQLVRFLDRQLPPKWEIYVQPYLNNDRPDLVLLHPQIGLQIIEVKDWAPGLYRSEKATSQYSKTGRTKCKFSVRDKNGDWQEISSPLEQVERYRNNLINLYMPQLGEAIDANSKHLAPLKLSIYLHRMTTKEAQELIQVDPSHYVVFGHDVIAAETLKSIVPDYAREKSYYMTDRIADELRTWLMPPFHSMEQGTDIKLTNQQLKYSRPVRNKKQILHGVPGSGKTLVLAQRAASVASQGKKVLILTFNITLWHYVHDQINRARFAFDWTNIEIRHFHEFCWMYFSENNIPRENDSYNDHYYRVAVPQKVIDCMSKGLNVRKRQYDAILIDEGQDYEELWYEALEMFLSPRGQVLFVVDKRQNIYGRDLAWTNRRLEELPELTQSFRLPSPAIDQANRFASLFLIDIFQPIQLAFPLDQRQSHLFWRNVTGFDDAASRVEIAVDWLRTKRKIHVADIVILVPNHSMGLSLVERFEQRNIRVNHVFEEYGGDKRHKRAFWMLDSRLKMSTIHSFKGWELVNVILLTLDTGRNEAGNLDTIVYTALTRTRENLIVFNQMPRYVEFGEDWPSSWD
jgi:hypothetical protein